MKRFGITRNLLLIILPLLLFSVVLASAFYLVSMQNAIHKDAVQTDEQLMTHIGSSLELLMGMIQKSGDYLYDDEDFLGILNRASLYDYQAYREIDSQASGILISNGIIHSVTMIFPEPGIVYDSLYGFVPLSDYKQDQLLSELTDIQMTSRIITRTIYSSSFVSKPDLSVMTIIKPLPSVPMQLKNRGNLIININQEHLYQLLLGNISGEKNREMIIFGNNLEPLVFSRGSAAYGALSIYGDLSQFDGRTSLEWDGREYRLARKITPGSGWMLLLLTDISSMKQYRRTLMILVSSSGMIILIFLSITAYLLIRRTARPLDEMLEAMHKDEITHGYIPSLSNYMEEIIRDNSHLKKK